MAVGMAMSEWLTGLDTTGEVWLVTTDWWNSL